MNIFKTARADPIELLYQRYASRVYSLSLRLLDDIPAAEKATVTTFVTLARRLHQRATPKNVENLLIGITVDIARRHYGSALTSQTAADFGEGKEAGPETALGPETLNGAALEAAIRKLPLDLRFAFVLHDVGRLSHEEIAATLDWTVDLSRETLAGARVELRRLLLEAAQARSSLAPQHPRQQKTG
ncbi:MAG: sigma factor-like helix-turn-helix DNA-binding protein [Acidobacteriota bacterium]